MENKESWQKWQPADEELSSLLEPGVVNQLKEHNPLRVLKNKLIITMAWGVLITLGYIILFFFFHAWQVRASLAVLISFNCFIHYISHKLYLSINPRVSFGANVLQELQRHYIAFNRWWKIQERISLFVYPVAVAGGYILGGMVASGKTPEAFFSKPIALVALVICIAVLVPLSYLLARWMFNVAYGKHLKELKKRIDELRSGE